MNVTDLLIRQTKDAHIWTNKLIDSIPMENWDDTPNILASNISWQVGHLIISENYHGILVIKGFDEEILKKIDLRTLNMSFGHGSEPKDVIGITNPKLLKDQLLFSQAKVIATIGALPVKDLEQIVEQPVPQKHPVAETKLEAISWNIKHTMWHCGQIASIKRLIHGGYDYGIPKIK